MSEIEGNHSTNGSSPSTTELGVSEASLELAERVALRLDIYDKPAIFNMLSSRAKLGAGIVTVSLLFWWLLISNSSSDDLGVGVSKFFALDFNEVALAVMALSFLHSAFGDFGREMGSLVPSLISGVKIIMVLLYVGEPIVTAFMSDSIEVNTGLWRSARLALVGGVPFSEVISSLMHTFCYGCVVFSKQTKTSCLHLQVSMMKMLPWNDTPQFINTTLEA